MPPATDPTPPRDWRQIWQAPHRPLFLAAFLWALVTVLWWPLGDALGLPPPFEPAALWHVHELLFGFAAAAVGGYLLTALPSWTAAPPVTGANLKTLVLLWALARLTTLFALSLPLPLLLIGNGGYFGLLALLLGRQIVAAAVWRKLGFVAAVLLLGGGDMLYLTGACASWPSDALAMARVAVTGFALLIVSISGRAIPAFTRNWFLQSGRHLKVHDAPRRMLLTQTLLVLAMAGKLTGWPDMAHVALIGAAIAALSMMQGWQGIAARHNPLLAALHLGFLWVPVGLALMGVTHFFPGAYSGASALHALTIGAMSGLIMAISGRAAARRVDGDLRARPGFVIGAALIWVATCLRLTVPLSGAFEQAVLIGSAAVWCAAWVAFIIGFLPALSGPVLRPVFSGRKFQQSAGQTPPAPPIH